MAHPIQQAFFRRVRKQFNNLDPTRVLDVGSLDINGNTREFFSLSEYTGLDVVPGPNVDIVSIAHESGLPDEYFDAVVSANAMEHDLYWEKTLEFMLRVLHPGGLLIISVANTWEEHGTKRTTPINSGTSKMGPEWENYYRNLSPSDLLNTLHPIKNFKNWWVGIEDKDTQFWGIKKEAK